MLNDLPIQTIIKEQDVVVQQIIVNNEIQEVTAKANCLCCSSCNNVIYTFNSNVKYTEAYSQLVTVKDKLATNFPVCSKCGKKLRYDFDIIDGELVNE